MLLGLSFSFSSCSSFSFLSVLFFLCLLVRPYVLYTLSANAAGNRTLCDLCQAKYQRKQTRHKERRIVEHDAAEELDGTREHRKKEQLSWWTNFFLYRSTNLECVPDSSSPCALPRNTSTTHINIIYFCPCFWEYFLTKYF